MNVILFDQTIAAAVAADDAAAYNIDALMKWAKDGQRLLDLLPRGVKLRIVEDDDLPYLRDLLPHIAEGEQFSREKETWGWDLSDVEPCAIEDSEAGYDGDFAFDLGRVE